MDKFLSGGIFFPLLGYAWQKSWLQKCGKRLCSIRVWFKGRERENSFVIPVTSFLPVKLLYKWAMEQLNGGQKVSSGLEPMIESIRMLSGIFIVDVHFFCSDQPHFCGEIWADRKFVALRAFFLRVAFKRFFFFAHPSVRKRVWWITLCLFSLSGSSYQTIRVDKTEK